VVELFEKRSKAGDARLDRIRASLESEDERIKGCACVYATGSFGRGDASEHSDLDLFIVGGTKDDRRLLSRLDEILVKAALIEATRQNKIPDFDGDGAYLQHYTIDELNRGLGQPNDDATNTFTARLLLLLESRPLLGGDVYDQAIDAVIGAYWRDYDKHKNEFVPAFLANDILRIWRTFCVNYEARTQSDPDDKKAKRKLKNYKLKHSRLLTCYSGLAYLLAIYSLNRTVSRDDAREMVRLRPIERLLQIQSVFPGSDEVRKCVDGLLKSYETFLTETDAREDELVKRFLDSSTSVRRSQEAMVFGDSVFSLLDSIGRQTPGKKNRFYRLLVV